MATAMFDAFETMPTARAPISRHPLFPAVVALWFATLLGLGTLVLPVALIERWIDASRLGTWLPAFAPPLSSTARMLLVVLGGTSGAGLGLVLARQLVRTHRPDSAQATRDMPPHRRPISAHEELGHAGFALSSQLGLPAHIAEPVAEPAVSHRMLEEPLELTDIVDDPAPAADFPAPRFIRPIDPAAELDPAEAPLESLGLVQLVQRLGRSLEKRRQRIAAAQSMSPVASFSGPALTAVAFGRPARPFDPPAPAPADFGGAVSGYASSADADEALRRALDTLQRMTAAG